MSNDYNFQKTSKPNIANILKPEFKLDRSNPTIDRLCELRDCTHQVKDFRIQNTYKQITAKDVTVREVEGFVDSWTTTQDRFPKTADILKWVIEHRQTNPETKKEVKACRHGFCSGDGYVEVKQTQGDEGYRYLKWCACNPEIGMKRFISKVLPLVTGWQKQRIDSVNEESSHSQKGIEEGRFYCDLVSRCEIKPTDELWNKIKSQEINVPDEYSDMKQSLIGKGKDYPSVSNFLYSLWGDEIRSLPKLSRPQKKWIDSDQKKNQRIAKHEEMQTVFNILSTVGKQGATQ